MTGRITQNTSNRLMLANLQRAHRAQTVAQERLASQRALSRASDGPGETVNALGHRASLARMEQLTRNANDARDRLQLTDDTLVNVSETLAFAKTRLVAAISPIADGAARPAMATELRGARTTILDLANTKHRGLSVFSGNADVSAAYSDGTPAAYNGNAGLISTPVSMTETVEVNAPGPQVFGTHNAGDPFAGDIFQLLEAAALAVESGDHAGMSAALSAIDAAMTRVATQQVKIGARSNQVELVLQRNMENSLTTRQALSEVEDIDVAETLMNLRAREFSYETALAVAGRTMNKSLLDFLR